MMPNPNIGAADLPDDVLFSIFSRTTMSDVVRCAATCRRWARAVAACAAALSRVLPPPGRFIPQLARGFFFLHHQQEDNKQHQRLSFVPRTMASPSAHPQQGSCRHRPVTSRNGRVVLELSRRRGVLSLSVWNPTTGHVSTAAPLPDFHGRDYACAILADDDLDDAPPGSFRLLLVYNRRRFTVLRAYSSDTGRWGPEGSKSGAKIRGRLLRKLGQAAVLRGAAYWPLLHAAFGVRLLDDGDTCRGLLLPYRNARAIAEYRALGLSPDGTELRYLGVGFMARRVLCVSFITSQLLGPTTSGYYWDNVIDHHIRVPGVRITWPTTTVKLRWFGEKSGMLIFTVGDQDTGTSAVFALDVATSSLEKLVEGGAGYHACTDLCGYEMDYAGLLASVASPRVLQVPV